MRNSVARSNETHGRPGIFAQLKAIGAIVPATANQRSCRPHNFTLPLLPPQARSGISLGLAPTTSLRTGVRIRLAVGAAGDTQVVAIGSGLFAGSMQLLYYAN